MVIGEISKKLLLEAAVSLEKFRLRCITRAALFGNILLIIFLVAYLCGVFARNYEPSGLVVYWKILITIYIPVIFYFIIHLCSFALKYLILMLRGASIFYSSENNVKIRSMDSNAIFLSEMHELVFGELIAIFYSFIYVYIASISIIFLLWLIDFYLFSPNRNRFLIPLVINFISVTMYVITINQKIRDEGIRWLGDYIDIRTMKFKGIELALFVISFIWYSYLINKYREKTPRRSRHSPESGYTTSI